MKNVFIIFFLCISHFAFAQIPKGEIANRIVKWTAKTDTIDTSNFECIYQLNVTDPIKAETRQSYGILISGSRYSMFKDYNSYRLDSVINTMDKTKITYLEYSKISGKYRNETTDIILRDRQNAEITFYGRVFIDKYKYKEPQPEFNWQLSDETKTVCGTLCHKATCSFRGRDWTVWYSDIPVSEGPWKFGGLPGLILEAEDSTKEIMFTALSLRKMQRPITMENLDYFNTTREKYNKALTDFKTDPGKTISSSELAPKDNNGNKIAIPQRRMFFNPIEKE